MHKSIVVGLALLIGHTVDAQELPDLTNPQWVEDFDQLKREILSRHINPLTLYTKEQYENKVANLGYSLDELSTEEKLVELLVLSNYPGDVATFVEVEQYFRYYPVKLFWYENTLRVEHIDVSLKEYAGFKVTAIAGTDLKTATEKVQELIADYGNLYHNYTWSQKWLSNADILKIQGIAKSDEEITYTLEDDAGNTKELKLTAVNYNRLNDINWTQAYEVDQRLAFNQKDFFAIKFNDQTVYIRYSKYPDKAALKAELNNLSQLLENEAYTKLIIDLRQNEGHNDQEVDFLIKKIEKSDFLDKGKVYVTTSRHTAGLAYFSALELKEELAAMLVGEPPAQSPLGYEPGYVGNLTYSGIAYGIAGSLMANESTNTFLEMDQQIDPSFEANMAGEDPVIAWILSQP